MFVKLLAAGKQMQMKKPALQMMKARKMNDVVTDSFQNYFFTIEYTYRAREV